jgi:hypothetical protein
VEGSLRAWGPGPGGLLGGSPGVGYWDTRVALVPAGGIGGWRQGPGPTAGVLCAEGWPGPSTQAFCIAILRYLWLRYGLLLGTPLRAGAAVAGKPAARPAQGRSHGCLGEHRAFDCPLVSVWDATGDSNTGWPVETMFAMGLSCVGLAGVADFVSEA